MKRLVSFFLILTLTVTLLLPFSTLGSAAETTAATLPEDGTLLYEQTFSGSTSNTSATLSALNGMADTYSLADFSVLSGSTTGALKLTNGALSVDATQDLVLQILSGERADQLASARDYTVTFDLTYTDGAANDLAALRLSYKDNSNYMETGVRLRGDGYLVACSGGTKYSLEDDGFKATSSEVINGKTSWGHVLHSLKKTSGTTLLTLLHGTDASISETYNSSATPLKGKTLHYCVESIHGAGVIVSINGVVVTTTVKNVYYYDQLSALSGRMALYFSAGTKATLDNLAVRAGGAFTLSTNSLGVRVMSINTLFSGASGTEPNDIYSMHWLVDESGKLRMDALMNVIEQQSPDIVGFQERHYLLPDGSGGSENTIVEKMISLGYGVIANKLRQNAADIWDNPSGRYDAYNWMPIFYKTSRFILMNDSSREDEFIKGVSGVEDVRVANGTLIFDQSSKEMWLPAYDPDTTYTVQLLIGAQKDEINTAIYEAVSVRYYGRMFGEGNPQKTAVELRYRNSDPTNVEPVELTDTEGWLDVSSFNDTKLAQVTYNATDKKVYYNGTAYEGAYYIRCATEPIAVLLTNYTGTSYNPDSTQYSIFREGSTYYSEAVFPCGYTEKTVAEVRYRSTTAEHRAQEPVTLTSSELISGNYLNVTTLTQAQYDSITMTGNGTEITYQGRTYAGMYYIRAHMTALVGTGDSKGVTWGVLRLRENGQMILTMNTHCALLLGWQQQLSDGEITAETAKEWRIDNARQIQEVMETVFETYGELPTYITGDFNMGNSDPMYTALMEVFDDAARLAPNTVFWEYTHHTPGLITTPTGNQDAYGNPTFYYKDTSLGAYPVPGYPIDHIFTTKDDFTVTSYNVLNDIYDEDDEPYNYGSEELHMTDHCALVVEMQIAGVSAPGCSHDDGVYTDLQTVTLSAACSLDTIYYTTDGSDPTTSTTRRTYTGEFEVYGDVGLRAVACRNGVYSRERVVNFSLCGELAITEIICNPSGWDILEGFEVVNTSTHTVDLADYTFWCLNSKTAAGLRDGAFTYTYNMNHMRINEQGKYLVAPGEVFFVWTVMDDTYKAKLNYGAGLSDYAVEFVTEEGLADAATLARWAELGYTGSTVTLWVR